MIRHGGLFLTASVPVLALPVVVVELSFGALLVAFVGLPALLAPGVIAAGVAAIAVSAITVRADIEDRLALWMDTRSLKENCFAVGLRHASSQAGLDNGAVSWQVKTSVCLVSNLRRFAERPNPAALTAGFFTCATS